MYVTWWPVKGSIVFTQVVVYDAATQIVYIHRLYVTGESVHWITCKAALYMAAVQGEFLHTQYHTTLA